MLYTLECWLQDHVDRKSFHNVSNFAPNVNLPLAWPISVTFRSNLTYIPFKDDPHIVEQKLDATNSCSLRTFEVIIYILPLITMLMGRVWGHLKTYTMVL